MGRRDETHSKDAVKEGTVVACYKKGGEREESEAGVDGRDGVDETGETFGKWGGLGFDFS